MEQLVNSITWGSFVHEYVGTLNKVNTSFGDGVNNVLAFLYQHIRVRRALDTYYNLARSLHLYPRLLIGTYVPNH